MWINTLSSSVIGGTLEEK